MEDEIIVNGIVYVVKKQNEGYVVMKKENGNLVLNFFNKNYLGVMH